jgi:hypothetical protein
MPDSNRSAWLNSESHLQGGAVCGYHRDAQGASFLARPFGNVHSSHRRCPVRAGLGAFEQRPQVAQQILLVVLRGLSVHAHGAVFARAQISLVQPAEVDVVGQGSEPHLGGLLRQLCYSLLSR